MSQDQEEGRFHEVTSITGDQVGKAGIQEGSNRSGKKKRVCSTRKSETLKGRSLT